MSTAQRRLAILLLLMAAVAANCLAEPTGTAVYYADSLAGNAVANGDIYAPDELTAGHKTLAFGTAVELTNLSNDRSVAVEINDRLPRTSDHLVIVSRVAAGSLKMLGQGVARIRLRVIRGEEGAEIRGILSGQSDYNKPSPFPNKRTGQAQN
jgi:rare lipoprotein A